MNNQNKKQKIKSKKIRPQRHLKNLNQVYRDAVSGRYFHVWEEGDIDIHNRTNEGGPNYILRCYLWDEDDADQCTLQFGLILAGNYKKHLQTHYNKNPALQPKCESFNGLHLRCFKLKFSMSMSSLYEWKENVHILSRRKKLIKKEKKKKIVQINDKK